MNDEGLRGKLDEEYQKWSLTIDTHKTDYSVVENTCRVILLAIRWSIVVGVDSYLNVMVTEDRTDVAEIKIVRKRETIDETVIFYFMEQSGKARNIKQNI